MTAAGSCVDSLEISEGKMGKMKSASTSNSEAIRVEFECFDLESPDASHVPNVISGSVTFLRPVEAQGSDLLPSGTTRTALEVTKLDDEELGKQHGASEKAGILAHVVVVTLTACSSQGYSRQAVTWRH